MPIQTEEQRQRALTDAGVLASSLPAALPTANAPVDVSTLGGTTPFTLPPAPTAFSLPPASSDIFGVQAARQATDSALGALGGLYEKQGTQAARRQELEGEQKLPELNNELQELYDIDTQYQSDLRNLSSQGLRSQLQSEDRLAPTFAIRGEQAQAARQAEVLSQGINIKRSTNAAIIAQKQGKVALAQEYIQRALDAEFKPLEGRIEFFKQVLDMNRDRLNTVEQAQITKIIEDDQRAYTEQRQTRDQVLQIAREAASMNADTATVNRILAAKTSEDAISAAGSVLGTELRIKLQQQAFENNLALRDQQLREQASSGNTATAGAANDLVGLLGNNKISAGTKTAVGTILGVINAAETLAKSNPDGKFAGFYPGASLVNLITPNGWKRQETVENEGYLDAINLKVQQWASGAALTVEQTKQVQRFTPAKNDSDRIVKTKLNNLVNFMQQQIRGSLAAEGIVYTPEPIDIFASTSTLEDIFND